MKYLFRRDISDHPFLIDAWLSVACYQSIGEMHDDLSLALSLEANVLSGETGTLAADGGARRN